MALEDLGGKSVCNLIWIASEYERDLHAYRRFAPAVKL